MKKTIWQTTLRLQFLILLAALFSSLAGCVLPPTSNAGYFALDPAQAEANRKNTHRIEQEGRDMDHIERMRRAEAINLATRNNFPNNNSTRTTVINNY